METWDLTGHSSLMFILQDVISNKNIQLDQFFRSSMVTDIANVCVHCVSIWAKPINWMFCSNQSSVLQRMTTDVREEVWCYEWHHFPLSLCRFHFFPEPLPVSLNFLVQCNGLQRKWAIAVGHLANEFRTVSHCVLTPFPLPLDLSSTSSISIRYRSIVYK